MSVSHCLLVDRWRWNWYFKVFARVCPWISICLLRMSFIKGQASSCERYSCRERVWYWNIDEHVSSEIQEKRNGRKNKILTKAYKCYKASNFLRKNELAKSLFRHKTRRRSQICLVTVILTSNIGSVGWSVGIFTIFIKFWNIQRQ